MANIGNHQSNAQQNSSIRNWRERVLSSTTCTLTAQGGGTDKPHQNKRTPSEQSFHLLYAVRPITSWPCSWAIQEVKQTQLTITGLRARTEVSVNSAMSAVFQRIFETFSDVRSPTGPLLLKRMDILIILELRFLRLNVPQVFARLRSPGNVILSSIGYDLGIVDFME